MALAYFKSPYIKDIFFLSYRLGSAHYSTKNFELSKKKKSTSASGTTLS